MRCSSCGERLAATDERCPLCGAAASAALARSNLVPRCPRCRYAGEGIAYFRRPAHLLLLGVVSVFTWGLGGIAYWLLRRGRSVCPNCGLVWPDSSWEPVEGALSSGGARNEPPLPSGGFRRRAFGVALAILAAIGIGVGLGEAELAPLIGGAVFGLAGTGVFFWGWQALRERRQALRQRLERRVIQLATRKGGSLTVTEVASDLDLSLAAAEGVLIGMDDGFRVRSDITQEGVLVFEFPEVQHRRLSG